MQNKTKGANCRKAIDNSVQKEHGNIAFVAMQSFFCLCIFFYLFFTTKYTLYFRGDMATFINDAEWIHLVADKPGGICELLSLFVMQLFTSPLFSAISVSVIIGISTFLTGFILFKLGKNVLVSILSLAIGASQSFLLADINFNMTAIVSFGIILLFLTCSVFIKEFWYSFVYALISTIVLAWVAGPSAMLFTLAYFIIAISRFTKRGLLFIILPIASWLVGLYLVDLGFYPGVSSALTPKGFYTPWMESPSYILMMWIALLVSLIVASVARYISIRSKGLRTMLTIIGIACIAAFLFKGYKITSENSSEGCCELSLYSDAGQWDKIIQRSGTMNQEDLGIQNFRNLALAEKGQLCDVIFHYPCSGILSVVNEKNKTPQSYMLLSDIYFSMGHIALAQQHAFEANEALGNYSPRMLKRLVDTNIIFGQTAAAKKYINLLLKTKKHSEWAKNRLALLENPEELLKHPVLGEKMKCIPKTNSLSTVRGLDNDLLDIQRSNLHHSTTMQYLGALYLLAKDTPALMSAIKEFYGTESLRVLPIHFQEALAIDVFATNEPLDEKYNIHPNTLQRCKAFWAYKQPQPNTYWHYLKYNDK